MSGFFEVQRGEDAVVSFRESGDSGDGLRGLIDADLMMLNALKLLDRAFWRQVAVGGAEALAHDAIEDQGDEANAGMRLDAFGQAMKHGADFNL